MAPDHVWEDANLVGETAAQLSSSDTTPEQVALWLLRTTGSVSFRAIKVLHAAGLGLRQAKDLVESVLPAYIEELKAADQTARDNSR